MARSTRDLSDRHEDFLAELIDGRRTPGSGNHFANQGDVRGDHRRQNMAFALDGKATEGKSITIKLSDWEKIVEQAHDEIPGMGLRFYLDGTLRRTVDLIVVEATPTFQEMFWAVNLNPGTL